MCALVAFALVLEAIALATDEQTAWTISQLVWRATYSTPLVPLLFGVLMGHFFFPKGSCVHCGLRPWAGNEQGALDNRLQVYHAERVTGAAHEAAKLVAGFPHVPKTSNGSGGRQ